jgi:predicted MPP superfamily phosphohydrolase
MSRMYFPWLFILFFLLLDWYVFQALKAISGQWSLRTTRWVYIMYWSVCLVSVGFFLSLILAGFESWHKLLRTYLFAGIIGLFIAKFISGLFFLMDDLRRAFQYIGSSWVPVWKKEVQNGGISRSAFISWMGFITGGSLFTTLLYGFGNKYKYTLKNIRLSFENLPQSFQGFRIIHISDIHSGSFTDMNAVKKGIDLINQQKADLILFTGDLVNQKADEMEPFIEIFSSLRATHGVYATLGNHDYGFPKRGEEDIRLLHLQNAAAVEDVHQRMGWKLLRNTHIVLEKNQEKMAVIGVENISAKTGFPSYGNLKPAIKGTEDIPFKILMSHDPSHWNAEITQGFTDIDLTLSGHTHGMQFGVEIPGFRWSPVKYIYKQWAGLYEEKKQKLYVNRGFGFIGYPGRVGILPEITLIELA